MTVMVTRVRSVDSGEVDRGGKSVMVETRSEHKAWGFAPLVQVETDGVEKVVANYGGALYFRSPNFCYAQADDRFIVRGVEYDADGPDADWHHPDSVHKGTVVVLRRSEVVRG